MYNIVLLAAVLSKYGEDQLPAHMNKFFFFM